MGSSFEPGAFSALTNAMPEEPLAAAESDSRTDMVFPPENQTLLDSTCGELIM
jgi:hypothetical protein